MQVSFLIATTTLAGQFVRYTFAMQQIVSVVELCAFMGITGSPEEWMSENIGALLYLCGDDIAVKVLMSKAINGRVLELACIVVSLCVVCARQAEPTSWAVVVLRRVLASMDNGRDRLALLRAVVDTFRDNVAELHDYHADDPSALLFQLLCLTVYMIDAVLMIL